MRLSIILAILLLIVVGFLMVYNAFGNQDRDAAFSRIMIIIVGIMILGGGIYLLIKYLVK